MAETSEMELDLLQRRARELNFWIGRHVHYDPTVGGGDLYIMNKRRHAGERSRFASQIRDR